MKLDAAFMTSDLARAGEIAAALEAQGHDGLYSFEGPHDPFFPLVLAAQATALLAGRDFVVPDDVTRVVQDVLVHRLSLRRTFTDTLEERRVCTTILRRILSSIPEPG